MTGLHVAEPQPLWLLLQHTLGISEIVSSPAEVAVAVVLGAGIIVEASDALVEIP